MEKVPRAKRKFNVTLAWVKKLVLDRQIDGA